MSLKIILSKLLRHLQQWIKKDCLKFFIDQWVIIIDYAMRCVMRLAQQECELFQHKDRTGPKKGRKCSHCAYMRRWTGHHWFRYWLVDCSARLYLNQWWPLNHIQGTYFNEKVIETNKISLAKLHLKVHVSSVILLPFLSSGRGGYGITIVHYYRLWALLVDEVVPILIMHKHALRWLIPKI